jgi:hypothetical protein
LSWTDENAGRRGHDPAVFQKQYAAGFLHLGRIDPFPPRIVNNACHAAVTLDTVMPRATLHTRT